MRLIVAAIGRLGATNENELVKDYVRRASLTGRSLGLGPVELLEIEPKASVKHPTKAQEALAITSALGEDALLIACDERGLALSSRQLAAKMDKLKDDGHRRLAFVIGGADGLDPDLVAAAHMALAFGPQTWPHALVRVMLAEQIYRGVSILAGTPYHRD
jgi:23S rRNA (pseudouridine1915-N3)-methyltransferase